MLIVGLTPYFLARLICTNCLERACRSTTTPVVERRRLTPRSSQWNGSLNRSELEVQFLEAPEQKGAVPFEPTIACRAVLGL
jgi:hypothetical protein